MPRAMNPDGTPWWVSSGPPARSGEPAAGVPPEAEPVVEVAVELDVESEPVGEGATQDRPGDWSELLDPALAAATLRAGAGLLAGFLDLVTAETRASTAPPTAHDVAACGFCPVCVAVAALKEHDQNLGELVESALGGVTSSAERIAELVPHSKDVITEQLVEAVARALLSKVRL